MKRFLSIMCAIFLTIFALLTTCSNEREPGKEKPMQNPDPEKWVLVGHIGGCRLYTKCIKSWSPAQLGCETVYWSICGSIYSSSVTTKR